MPNPTCSVEGCEKPTDCRTWCSTHYARWRRHGSVDVMLRAPNGAGTVMKNGYRIRQDWSHPFAKAEGKVLEHRAVLYDALGPGVHACHWCGKWVSWEKQASEVVVRLVVDHLDEDKLNNAPENLVPSCTYCNSQRGRGTDVATANTP